MHAQISRHVPRTATGRGRGSPSTDRARRQGPRPRTTLDGREQGAAGTEPSLSTESTAHRPSAPASVLRGRVGTCCQRHGRCRDSSMRCQCQVHTTTSSSAQFNLFEPCESEASFDRTDVHRLVAVGDNEARSGSTGFLTSKLLSLLRQPQG